MKLFSVPEFSQQARLAGRTDKPVKNYGIIQTITVLSMMAAGGCIYYWWRKGYHSKTNEDIRLNDEKSKSEGKEYEVKRHADGLYEQVKCAAEAKKHNTECSADILKIFAEKRADADRYHANAMTDIEKSRMMYELKREFKDIIREERMNPDDQEAEEDEEDLDDLWEDFNDAVYNHPDEVFSWLVGNTIKSGGINVLIGPKGIGKTLCLTTIINCIAKGIPLDLFVSDPSKPYYQPAQKVFLYDLEMQYEDLSERNGKHGYEFTNIKRNTKMYNVNSWLKSVMTVANGLKEDATIVLDNVTRLNDDVTQPGVAKRLFDSVKNIRDDAKGRGIKLTFILVAHTTNDWNDWVPLTLKAAAVADSFTTGLDSISFIGKTKYEGRVLFKVFNQRHGRYSDKVALLKFVDKPFLGCEIEGYYKENEVKPNKDGKTTSYTVKNERIDNLADVEEPKIKGWPLSKLLELKKESEAGVSQRKLGEKYGLKAPEIGRKLKALKEYLDSAKREDDEGVAE